MSKKTIYLLHYPDGTVSATPINGMRPDAFLFGNTWISFKVKNEYSTYRQAVELVSSVRISGYPCRLLSKENLQSFLANLTEINDLREKCGFARIQTGYFWAARSKETSYKVSLKVYGKGCIEKYLSVNGTSPMSIAVPATQFYKCLAQRFDLPVTETYIEEPAI